MRGANAHNVFKNTLLASSTGPTRMKDATTEAEWREKGFFSVTSGGKQSILYQLLEHGKDNEAGFDLREPYALYDGKASELDFQCVDRKEIASRVQRPGTGMPFGLSAIPDAEYTKLLSWVERGAPGPSAEAQKMLATPRDQATVAKWEAFFNQDSPKARLAMRYLYEHLYYARLHIDDSTEGNACSRVDPVPAVMESPMCSTRTGRSSSPWVRSAMICERSWRESSTSAPVSTQPLGLQSLR